MPTAIITEERVIVKSGVWHSGRFLCWLLVFLFAIFEDDVVDH